MGDSKITAKNAVMALEKLNIFPDFRGDILRLCPAIYHTIFDIDTLVAALKDIDEKLIK